MGILRLTNSEDNVIAIIVSNTTPLIVDVRDGGVIINYCHNRNIFLHKKYKLEYIIKAIEEMCAPFSHIHLDTDN